MAGPAADGNDLDGLAFFRHLPMMVADPNRSVVVAEVDGGDRIG